MKAGNPMRNKWSLRVLAVVLSVLTFVCMTPWNVYADDDVSDTVSYIVRSWDGSKVLEGTATITDYVDMQTVSGGTIGNGNKYVVKTDQTIDGRLTVQGECHIILMDGVTLTVNGGIRLTGNNSLNIYGQTAGSGELIINRTGKKQAGIGGNDEENGGSFTLHGGKVSVPANVNSSYAAGIGGGRYGHGGTVVIYGGEATVNGGYAAAGFGGGQYGKFSNTSGESFTMYGGNVKAYGGRGFIDDNPNRPQTDHGAGIGSGYLESDNTDIGGGVGIYGGTLEAAGGNNAAGIGGGHKGKGCSVTIMNAAVKATGGYLGAGIGGGYHGNGGTVTVENSTVIVSGGSSAAAIGKGSSGSNGSLTLDDDLQVSAGSKAGSMSLVNAASRLNAAQSSQYAKIEPCRHTDLTYTRVDKDTHRVNCSYCLTYNNKTEGHAVEGHTCTKCGMTVFQAIFDPCNGDDCFSEYYIPEESDSGGYLPWTVTLPAAPANAPDGKVFSSWLAPDGNTYAPGQTYELTGTAAFTAVWKPAYAVTYDPNNGDAPYTLIKEGSADDQGNPTGCGFMTDRKPENAPDGKQFAGWAIEGDDTNTLYAENDFVWITGPVTLKAQWSDHPTLTIKAVDIDGEVSGITSLTCPCYDDTTAFKDILIPDEYEILSFFREQLPEGYEIYIGKPFLPKELSKYESYSEMPSLTSNEEWLQATITTENCTVYVPFVKTISEADIPLTMPAVGSSVVTRKNGLTGGPNPFFQDPRPGFDITQDDPYAIPPINGGYEHYWNVDPASGSVTDGTDSEGQDAFVMTFGCGDTYKAIVRLDAKVGYLFGEDPAVTVNGQSVVNSVSDSGSTLTVTADVLMHDYQVVPGVAPTCTEPGLTEGRKCSTCGDTIVEQQVIPATGHTEAVLPAAAPTCTEPGLTEGKKCSVCGEILLAQEEIPALGHDYQEGPLTAFEATCTDDGKEADQECSRCHDMIAGAEIPALGHDYQDIDGTARDATCTEAGKEADQECSRCHESIDGAEIPAMGHTLTKTDAKPATCKEPGNIEYWHCGTCEKYFSDAACTAEVTQEETVTEQLRHSLIIVPAKKAIHKVTGNIEHYKCELCGDLFFDAEGNEPATSDDVLLKRGWLMEDGEWHYYDVADAADKGTKRCNAWAQDSIGWCWLDGEGCITKGKWIKDNGEWYYLKPDGYMAANEWAKDSKGWMWMTGSGKIARDRWVKDKGEWYYLKANGYMAANEWAKDSKGWLWMQASGKAAKSKWIQYKGSWYYLDASGYMVTGTQKIGGKTYRFDSSGKWIP